MLQNNIFYNIYKMEREITEEQARALGNLMAELDAASNISLGKRLVPGREEGYFKQLLNGELPPHLKYPGEIKMTGGDGICDNIYVSLAIDSAIILAGAAVVAGAGYIGYATLQFFMTTYSLDAVIITVIKALFDSLVASGRMILTSVSTASSAATSIVSSSAPVISTVASGVVTSTGPISTLFGKLAPGVALGRYIGTNKNAYEDATHILNTLVEQYERTRRIIGVVTRSMVEKQQELVNKITEARRNISETYARTVESANSAVSSSTALFRIIKTKICELIDRAVTLAIDPVNVSAELNRMLADISISGGKKTKRRHSHKKRKTNKKRSKKHYKKHYKK